jgi:hypothetical protein
MIAVHGRLVPAAGVAGLGPYAVRRDADPTLAEGDLVAGAVGADAIADAEVPAAGLGKTICVR